MKEIVDKFALKNARIEWLGCFNILNKKLLLAFSKEESSYSIFWDKNIDLLIKAFLINWQKN